LLIILIALLIIFLENKQTKKEMLTILIFAIPLVLILALLGHQFIMDPRPYIVEGVKSIITTSADNGFPSDHTLFAMVPAFLVLIFNKKMGWFLFLLAILVALARVLGKAHHPLDVIASTIIAAISVGVGYFYLHKFGSFKFLDQISFLK
jgi:undecaprenyl-diphosphatase